MLKVFRQNPLPLSVLLEHPENWDNILSNLRSDKSKRRISFGYSDPDISSLPQIPDVVLIIPAIFVNEAAERAEKMKNLVIISAGFKEVGDKGLNSKRSSKNIICALLDPIVWELSIQNSA
jgi:hypothetical protein